MKYGAEKCRHAVSCLLQLQRVKPISLVDDVSDIPFPAGAMIDLSHPLDSSLAGVYILVSVYSMVISHLW